MISLSISCDSTLFLSALLLLADIHIALDMVASGRGVWVIYQ